ncbi:plasmid replication, integration and excision activator [Streptosporangium sp. NPDC000239]|uniref:plasmid replication, integration and excision activator n=1 Tax=Streptosporangium sp. NPDC000239 TaxID=3154248 RepID=UPI00331961FC
MDFEASTAERQVPARDKATGLPVWQVPVMDADPSVKVSAKSVAVKIISDEEPVVPPVPPALEALGVNLVPITFIDLAVTPWVNGDGSRARLAYSYRASGLRAAGSATESAESKTGKGRMPFDSGE